MKVVSNTTYCFGVHAAGDRVAQMIRDKSLLEAYP